MGSKPDGIDRRAFFGLTSAAAVAAAGGLSSAAAGPSPAKIEEIRSDNPHGGQLELKMRLRSSALLL